MLLFDSLGDEGYTCDNISLRIFGVPLKNNNFLTYYKFFKSIYASTKRSSSIFCAFFHLARVFLLILVYNFKGDWKHVFKNLTNVIKLWHSFCWVIWLVCSIMSPIVGQKRNSIYWFIFITQYLLYVHTILIKYYYVS